MKKLTYILVFIITSTILYSQEVIPDKQFMLGCKNVGVSEEVTHYIGATGEVWQWNGSTFVTGGIYNNSLVTVGNANFQSADWPGFNFNWLLAEPHWSLGLYKVTNSKQTDKYFYLDARDSDFGSAVYNPDFYIYFDNSDSTYYYNRSNPQEIPNGSLVSVWQIRNKTPNTSGLQNYWSNVLVLVNNGNNRPRLIWGSYQENSLSVQYYKIYKKKGTGNFALLTTTTGLEYTDQSEIIPTQPSTQVPVYYYVKAFGQLAESNYESGPTNTVSVNVSGGFEKSNINIEINLPAEYELNQNFPNPFNPFTIITYSVADNSFISLKVYDVLGNEITELVSEVQEPGQYSISFDGSILSSGIYFYTLKANGHSLTKKMLLAK